MSLPKRSPRVGEAVAEQGGIGVSFVADRDPQPMDHPAVLVVLVLAAPISIGGQLPEPRK